MQSITIKEYLTRKNISFRESGKELVTHCLFNNCDQDSRGIEAHLYFDAETGQYNCKKCGEKGNLITLAKHFGDMKPITPKTNVFDAKLVEKCHQALPTHIRQYLNARGITDAVISDYRLGYGQFYRKSWITIPIKDSYGNYAFFKLRQDPTFGNDKITYPKGVEAQLYDWEALRKEGPIVAVEGEGDRLLLVSKGVNAITSTHGAMTFKNEWVEKIGKGKKIYVCFDNDEAGRNGSERVAQMIWKAGNEVYLVTLPPEVGEHGDITDYFIKLGGTVEDLFGKYAKVYPEKVDVSRFKPMNSEDLKSILSLTIKDDDQNKVTTFLCQLSAYTDDAQFNISFNAPSSTGKSYIPLQISNLFPNEDVMKLGNCSPTAFFHEQGEYNKETNTMTVDLERKILIFTDMHNNGLLERLRPLLSHDEKEMQSKITDKNQKGGNRTKTIILKGYPSVICCTAGLKIDEQEATRFLLLSPEVSQGKIQQGISATIRRGSDGSSYRNWIEENADRSLLKERIRAIKLEGIKEIRITSSDKVEKRFLDDKKKLKPRHQRDVNRLLDFVKSFALLNVWFRERSGSTITANDSDIDEAFKLWEKVAFSQEMNLPPYVYNIYSQIILAAWEKKNAGRRDLKIGLSRREVLAEHYAVYGRMLDNNTLAKQILPMLETAGLIVEEQDEIDKRAKIIFPSFIYELDKEVKNSINESGVNPTMEHKTVFSPEEVAGFFAKPTKEEISDLASEIPW